MIRQNNIKLRHFEVEFIKNKERIITSVGAVDRVQAEVYIAEKHGIDRCDITECTLIK